MENVEPACYCSHSLFVTAAFHAFPFQFEDLCPWVLPLIPSEKQMEWQERSTNHASFLIHSDLAVVFFSVFASTQLATV